MSALERMSREAPMVSGFLDGVRALQDAEGNIILQTENILLEDLLSPHRDIIVRALSAELGRPLSPSALVFEVLTEENQQNDTVLDDILSAAEET
ncbi:MAG: hypothetical protein IKD28_05160 [Clostridia bacterium]|nr:hypothetical protein [Clostridia bacterium]